ncbi:MAG: hypothetical protein H5T64_07260 [Chloroflexi bacterium]|nr:hypothetical protein [Chloroflexota bacterium]
MQSPIEKGFVISLGLFAWGRDKVRSMVEKLPKRDELVKRGEQERSELKEKITTKMGEVLSEMGFATRADVEDLTRKIGGLAPKAKSG